MIAEFARCRSFQLVAERLGITRRPAIKRAMKAAMTKLLTADDVEGKRSARTSSGNFIRSDAKAIGYSVREKERMGRPVHPNQSKPAIFLTADQAATGFVGLHRVNSVQMAAQKTFLDQLK